MADVMPNPKLEIQRLRSQRAALQATVEQQRLAIMEMADRRERHEENIQASEKAIAEIEKNLRSLEGAHGKLTEAEYQAASESLTSTP